jgi:3-oxoacyl-(acyl-carrier-protein) synthase
VVLCLERALKSAGISPEEVSYINAHATSTQAGDMAEYRAIRKVFKHEVRSMRKKLTHYLRTAQPLLSCLVGAVLSEFSELF